MKIIDILQKLLIEQGGEGSDPKNPDVYPDQDEWGMDDAWTWDEWKIYYDALVKKGGKTFAKKRFLKYWEVVQEGTGVVGDDGMDPNWFKEKGMWYEDEDRPYTRQEFEDKLKGGDKNKTVSKKETEDTYSQQIQKALSHLNSFGYPKKEAAAIVANMKFESELNPQKINPNDEGSPSYGLIQWRGPDVKYENGKFVTKSSKIPSRLKNLLKRPNYNTMSTQINFLHDELTNDPYISKQYNKVKQGKNAYEMGTLFDEHVERSSGAVREKRGQYANKIYNDIINGHYQYT
jgi:hypothetical protein